MDILANEFEIEELTDWGFKHIDLGFNIDKITEGNTEDDHIPEVKESRVKLGDVWQLGKHRLMCGDSTKESDVNKLMNGEKADMVFTDPPYNVDYDGGSKKREKIKNDKLNDFSQFLNSCFSNMHLFMKDGSCIYITHSEVERLSFTETFKMVGFQLSSIIIWVKNNSTFSMNKDYKWKHEPIIYGWKKGSHNFYGDNTQDTVWLYDRPSKSKLHPTTKPIELINKAIKNSSKKKK
jgi:DNA modification methylase